MKKFLQNRKGRHSLRQSKSGSRYASKDFCKSVCCGSSFFIKRRDVQILLTLWVQYIFLCWNVYRQCNYQYENNMNGICQSDISDYIFLYIRNANLVYVYYHFINQHSLGSSIQSVLIQYVLWYKFSYYLNVANKTNNSYIWKHLAHIFIVSEAVVLSVNLLCCLTG